MVVSDTASTTSDWQPSALQRERDAYRRSRKHRSWIIAAISTALVAAVVVYVVVNSSGWARTRESFFDLRAAWSSLPDQLRALWLNVQIMVVSEVLVLLFAGLLAFMRTLRGPVYFPLRALATVYTDVFRGVPLLIVLLVVGFGLPSLRIGWISDSPFVLCIVALTLTYSAYVAEVFRAGVESVHPSQVAGARALGLSHVRAMRHVILPQAVRRVLPPLLNDFVSLQKDTALVSILGVVEVALTAENQSSQDFKFVYYLVSGAIFCALSIPLMHLTDWLAKRQGWVNTGAIR